MDPPWVTLRQAANRLAAGTAAGGGRPQAQMWQAMHDPSTRAFQADALFASAVQPCDEPDSGQVRQAIAAAIRAFGSLGCAERVAQEFGDHPETAVVPMRWARVVAREAFPDRAPKPGPRPDADLPLWGPPPAARRGYLSATGPGALSEPELWRMEETSALT